MRRHDLQPFFAWVVDVVDGDTIDVELMAEEPFWGHRLRVRIADIDAPEMYPRWTSAGAASQMFLVGLIYNELVCVRPRRKWCDPYGRVIASVLQMTQGMGDIELASWIDIGVEMIRSGHAVPYRVGGLRRKPRTIII